jgi:hypothetical protein
MNDLTSIPDDLLISDTSLHTASIPGVSSIRPFSARRDLLAVTLASAFLPLSNSVKILIGEYDIFSVPLFADVLLINISYRYVF